MSDLFLSRQVSVPHHDTFGRQINTSAAFVPEVRRFFCLWLKRAGWKTLCAGKVA
ncbi:hypothetical protein [Celeribacter sp.]|uniref:hypothetical protein n=1 Tax=Celeribacter sp. TaxID=1890673 RepID=UPI003A92470E